MTLSDDIAKALFSAGKQLYVEKKRRERDAMRARRAQMERWQTFDISLKDAVWDVMVPALDAATGGGTYRVSARTVYYQVRPLIQVHTDKELEYSYFSQDLLVEYQRDHGAIPALYREARGALHEPHTGRIVPLGTIEVADYRFPECVFNKILYVEKEGLDPIWATARLAERHDMAIASGKGQPVEAVRDLFARAEKGNYRLFVLHDADPAGYSIARTIAEATARMPGYSVDVIDMGLTVADAIDRGLPTETFTRRKALPLWMPARLNQTELDWFDGIPSGRRQWECTRVELNALSAPELVAYVEAGLETHDAAGKMVPPDEMVVNTAHSAHRALVQHWVADRLAEMFGADEIVDTLVVETATQVIDQPAEWITDAYHADRSTYWRDAIDGGIDRNMRAIDDALRLRLRELLSGP